MQWIERLTNYKVNIKLTSLLKRTEHSQKLFWLFGQLITFTIE